MCCNSRYHRSSGCCHGQSRRSFSGRHHTGKKEFGRSFTTREEKMEQIENYISELRKELKGAEQHLEKLKEEV